MRPSLALLASALIVLPTAAPTANAANASNAEPAAQSKAPATTEQLTLITGDKVSYTRGADGNESVAITAGPREQSTAPYFRTSSDPSGYYVIPSDAQDLIRADALDRELFDVRALAKLGTSGRLPVIASYAGRPAKATLERNADALPGSSHEAALPAVSGAALDVATRQAPDFWQAVRTRDRGLRKLWLDAPFQATLDESVPHIGAPAVWQTGHDGAGVKVAVLDTGIDATHPDLAGKIAAAKNFTRDPSAVDGNGHGTHVASTIAGTGAASGGSRKGVAPGATILAGKVLNDGGSGDTSGILEGIDWAIQSGARVINMSFGGGVTDGTDLLSQALNTYTQQTGVLFVVAAGNSGPTDGTVSSPGSADAALTVGAVDRQDAIAWFSSRGPRRGDGAVKPELTAPGWGIVAARAAGTDIGLPDGQYYTALSGTSMATPHVAGAAALLAQAHPDWHAAELKSALVGSAKPVGAHTFAGGAGRVDVARAYAQQVSTLPASLGFGSFAWPQTGRPPVDRVLTYRNDGTEPITLQLSADARTQAGQVAPAGALTFSADTVTVPAGGTASVTVTLDPAPGDTGAFGGQITATSTDGGTVVRTPLGYVKAVKTHHLTVKLLGSRGQPTGGTFNAVRADVLQHPANPFDQTIFDLYSSGGVIEADLPEGVYDLSGDMTENSLTSNRTTFAAEPEIDLKTGDAQLVLDARKGVALRPETAERTDPFAMSVGTVWKIGDHFAYLRGFSWGHNPDARMYGIPSSRHPSTAGRFTFETHWSFAPPLVEVQAGRHRAVTAYPVYFAAPMAFPRLDGDSRSSVVSVGAGDSAGFAGRDVAGKVVLVTLTPPATNPYNYLFPQVALAAHNANQAGAKAVLLHLDVPGSVLLQLPPPNDVTVPVLSLRYDEGVRLRELLAGGPADLKVKAVASPPSSYHLHYAYPAGIPSASPAPVRQTDVATVRMRLHGDGPAQLNTLAFFAHTDLPTNGLVSVGVQGPADHVVYIGPVNDDYVWHRLIYQWQPDGAPIQPMESSDSYTRPGWLPGEDWFAGPFTQRADALPADLVGKEFPMLCGYCREGDRFLPTGYDTDDDGHSTLTAPWLHQVRMFSGTTELELHPLSEDFFGVGYYLLPPEPAAYRLDDLYTDPRGGGREVRTSWTFRSAGRTAPASVPQGSFCVLDGSNPDASCRHEPLIGVRYRMDSALDNTVQGGRSQRLEVTAAQRPGGSVSGLTVATSYDDGLHWTAVPVRRRGVDTYAGDVHPPRTGHLSVKVTAWDDAGNRVEQEVIRAYGLR